MTDAEIIKALECCTNKGAKCSDCPAFKKVDRSDCKKYFRGAIDLINRQQAEIQRITEKFNCQQTVYADLSKIIKDQKAEIDRLKNDNEILSINADTAFQDGLNEAQDLYAEQVKDEIKSEAIKEFADRLKESAFKTRMLYSSIVYELEEDVIDNFVKEMVGEEE